MVRASTTVGRPLDPEAATAARISRHVVSVGGFDLPAEGAPLVRERLDRHDVRRRGRCSAVRCSRRTPPACRARTSPRPSRLPRRGPPGARRRRAGRTCARPSRGRARRARGRRRPRARARATPTSCRRPASSACRDVPGGCCRRGETCAGAADRRSPAAPARRTAPCSRVPSTARTDRDPASPGRAGSMRMTSK